MTLKRYALCIILFPLLFAACTDNQEILPEPLEVNPFECPVEISEITDDQTISSQYFYDEEARVQRILYTGMNEQALYEYRYSYQGEIVEIALYEYENNNRKELPAQSKRIHFYQNKVNRIHYYENQGGTIVKVKELIYLYEQDYLSSLLLINSASAASIIYTAETDAYANVTTLSTHLQDGRNLSIRYEYSEANIAANPFSKLEYETDFTHLLSLGFNTRLPIRISEFINDELSQEQIFIRDQDQITSVQDETQKSWLWEVQCEETPTEELPDNVRGEALRAWLRQNYYEGHFENIMPGRQYNTAREAMYREGGVDNHDGWVTCIYTGFRQMPQSSTFPNPINTEHTIPRSFFNEAEPMEGDMHHLFPTHMDVNNARSNYPFAEIDDQETDRWFGLTGQGAYREQNQLPDPAQIDLFSEMDARQGESTFEPKEDHKGNIARAIFYFYTVYPNQAGAITRVGELRTLYQWHLNDPVDEEEIRRNNAIEQIQHNRNFYIDHPEWVTLAWELD